MENISYFSEDLDFELEKKEEKTNWINSVISSYDKIPGEITYIFCSDDYLLKLNIEHLNHDTLTDIITFDYSKTAIISGDIFISIDRVKENSKEFKTLFFSELYRVLAHGVLHLLDYKDKSENEIKEMREKEEAALKLMSEISKINK